MDKPDDESNSNENGDDITEQSIDGKSNRKFYIEQSVLISIFIFLEHEQSLNRLETLINQVLSNFWCMYQVILIQLGLFIGLCRNGNTKYREWREFYFTMKCESII